MANFVEGRRKPPKFQRHRMGRRPSSKSKSSSSSLALDYTKRKFMLFLSSPLSFELLWLLFTVQYSSHCIHREIAPPSRPEGPNESSPKKHPKESTEGAQTSKRKRPRHNAFEVEPPDRPKPDTKRHDEKKENTPFGRGLITNNKER